jgi:flagellar biosynthesis repressor protein FlbT
MPLRVKLKADERVIINGALISARQTTALVIHNRVSLLRERQILPPHLVTSPARRIYFAIQCAYVADVEERPPYIEAALKYAQEFRDTTLSDRVKRLSEQVVEQVGREAFYEALRTAQEIMKYEDFVLGQRSWEEMNATGDA